MLDNPGMHEKALKAHEQVVTTAFSVKAVRQLRLLQRKLKSKTWAITDRKHFEA